MKESDCIAVGDSRISPNLFAKLLASKNGDALGLYAFLLAHAAIRRDRQPWLLNSYIMDGLSWGKSRVQAARHTLIKLELIEDVIRRDNGKVTGHYILLKYVNVKGKSSKPSAGIPADGQPSPSAAFPAAGKPAAGNEPQYPNQILSTYSVTNCLRTEQEQEQATPMATATAAPLADVDRTEEEEVIDLSDEISNGCGEHQDAAPVGQQDEWSVSSWSADDDAVDYSAAMAEAEALAAEAEPRAAASAQDGAQPMAVDQANAAAAASPTACGSARQAWAKRRVDKDAMLAFATEALGSVSAAEGWVSYEELFQVEEQYKYPDFCLAKEFLQKRLDAGKRETERSIGMIIKLFAPAVRPKAKLRVIFDQMIQQGKGVTEGLFDGLAALDLTIDEAMMDGGIYLPSINAEALIMAQGHPELGLPSVKALAGLSVNLEALAKSYSTGSEFLEWLTDSSSEGHNYQTWGHLASKTMLSKYLTANADRLRIRKEDSELRTAKSELIAKLQDKAAYLPAALDIIRDLQRGKLTINGARKQFNAAAASSGIPELMLA